MAIPDHSNNRRTSRALCTSNDLRLYEAGKIKAMRRCQQLLCHVDPFFSLLFPCVSLTRFRKCIYPDEHKTLLVPPRSKQAVYASLKSVLCTSIFDRWRSSTVRHITVTTLDNESRLPIQDCCFFVVNGC